MPGALDPLANRLKREAAATAAADPPPLNPPFPFLPRLTGLDPGFVDADDDPPKLADPFADFPDRKT